MQFFIQTTFVVALKKTIFNFEKNICNYTFILQYSADYPLNPDCAFKPVIKPVNDAFFIL